MRPMTDEELEVIRQRAERATPGPWWVEKCRTTGQQVLKFRHDDVPTWIADSSNRPEAADDFAFLAAARTDIPRLLAEVDRLRTVAAREGRRAEMEATR